MQGAYINIIICSNNGILNQYSKNAIIAYVRIFLDPGNGWFEYMGGRAGNVPRVNLYGAKGTVVGEAFQVQA